jgi:hypothetical protein
MVSGHVFIGAASGGHAHMARIYASPCSDTTARCAALLRKAAAGAQCSYSAWEARRRVSGDDEPSMVSLTVGHAASHVPSWRPRSPLPVDRVWIGCAG